MAKIICGVDVSAEWLDAHIGRETTLACRFARTAQGIEALAQFCKANAVDLVVMEATGGYEKLPFGLLWASGLPAAILNPRAVRRFAEAMGLLEKTDRIDAAVMVWFAEVKRIVGHEPPSAAQERLRSLVTRMRQIVELQTAQRNQRRLVTDPTVLAAFDELLALIKKQIRHLEAEIAELLDTDPLWRKLDEAFRTIKGVADRTVARLMAELPEIGTISNKAIAKLAGLAPIAHDSGKTTGKRPIRAGRSGVRSILYVVAEIVRRHEPDFAAFHQKLTAAGKPKKAIRVAIARKLLVRLNAKAREIRAQPLDAT